MSVPNLPASAEFRRGQLPDTAVNLAYLASRQITPYDVVVQNVAGSATGNVASYVDGLYFAGYGGILQGGQKITDRNLYVTDKFHDGDLSKPLFFIAKSRYYHLDWPVYTSGEEYTHSSITISETDGSDFTGNFIVTVEPYIDFVSDGLPYPYTGSPATHIDEIPYRIVVYLDTDRPLTLKYNKVESDLTLEENGRTETLNPYPYFVEDTLANVAASLPDDNTFFVNEHGDEYSVAVPATQITDTRKFEYFYWRIKSKLGRTIPPGTTEVPVSLSGRLGTTSTTGVVNATPYNSSDLFEHNNITSIPDPTYGSATFNGKTVCIGIYDIGQGYPAEYQSALYHLQVCQVNKPRVLFYNPCKNAPLTSESAGAYWKVTAADIDTDEKLDKYNILLIPVVKDTFPYNDRLDNWSKKDGKGIIFLFDHLSGSATLPNLDPRWGVEWDVNTTVLYTTQEVTDHDIITGATTPNKVTSAPLTESAVNPYIDDEGHHGDDELFETSHTVKASDEDKYESLIDAQDTESPAGTHSVCGIYDNRIVVLDPYSVVTVLGIPQVEDGELVNYDHSRHNHPEFYGLDSDDKDEQVDDYVSRITYQLNSLKLLFNCIYYLAGKVALPPPAEPGTTTDIPGTTTVTETYGPDPNYVPNLPTMPDNTTWIDYNTPYIRSWITTVGSLSTTEIAEDNKLVVIDGRLMRKLFSGNPQIILQSYVASANNVDFLSLGDLDAEVEIDNPRVTLYKDGDTYYAYTNTYGGVPFEPGISYPANWIRSDHWVSRRILSGGILNTDLYKKSQREKEVTYTETETITTNKIGVRKVPVTVTTPGATVYATHKPSWYIKTQTGGTPQQVTWTATGKVTGASPNTEEKKIVSGNATFTIKSKDMESTKSSAYAWVYLPQCDKLLSQGSTGADVKFWQTALNSLGYTLNPDGTYGATTKAQVLAFQGDHDEILEDGIIGPETGGRIADECAADGKFLPNHYQYVSTNNLLESASGTYGRRTNPFGVVYSQSSLQDYIKVSFSTAVDLSRIEISGYGGPASSLPFKVTQVTAWNAGGATKLADIKPDQMVSNGTITKISFPTALTGVKILYVHVAATSAYMKSTASAYFWGMNFIQGYGTGTGGGGVVSDKTLTGTISLLPGEAKDVTLPSSGADGTYSWSNLTATGTVTVSGSGTSWTITDTRTSSSSANGDTDTTTITAQDGVKTFAPLLPSSAVAGQTAILVASTDGSTIVQFYDGSKFIGSSIAVSSLTGSGNIKVGVKANDKPTTTSTTTTTTKDEQYTYSEVSTRDIVKHRIDIEDYVTSTGHILIEGQDPPPAFFAFKPYAVRQLDGRMNVKLFYPDFGLTHVDAWYPQISFGSFTRQVPMDGAASGWQAAYNGSSDITAVYSIPELDWSDKGDFTLKFIDEPLTFYGPRQVITKRSPLLFNETLDGKTSLSLSLNGTPLADSEIEDISKDGIITLTQSIDSSDVVTGTYYIRCTYKDIVGLNLNPYPGHTLTVDGRDYSTYQKIGLPVYVYLLPSYCRLNGIAIDDSVEDTVVNFTTNPAIFDTESDYYNRLAILIGVVSCTTPVTPEDVILLDARSRGGGADETEDTHYFDVDYFVDKSYPEKGFLIIEASLNDKARETELITGIEKNIAAGTIYKIRWLGFCLTRNPEVGACTAEMIAPTVSGES